VSDTSRPGPRHARDEVLFRRRRLLPTPPHGLNRLDRLRVHDFGVLPGDATMTVFRPPPGRSADSVRPVGPSA
jgi:hypothetical protein